MKKYEYKCVHILGFGETTGRILTDTDGKDGSLCASGEFGIIYDDHWLKIRSSIGYSHWVDRALLVISSRRLFTISNGCFTKTLTGLIASYRLMS